MFAPQVDTHIAVVGPFDFKRQNFDVVLHFGGFEFTTDQTLDAENRIFRIGNGLSFGDLADQSLAAFRYGHDRWRGSSPIGVGDHFGVTAFHNGHA